MMKTIDLNGISARIGNLYKAPRKAQNVQNTANSSEWTVSGVLGKIKTKLINYEKAFEAKMRELSMDIGNLGWFLTRATIFNLLMEALDPRWQEKYPFFSTFFDGYFAFWQWCFKVILKFIAALANFGSGDLINLYHEVMSQMGSNAGAFIQWCSALQL